MGDVILDDVTRVHPDGTVALAHVGLTAYGGEILALVGASGAGKSTLLRVIAGLDPIAGGTIHIDGQLVNDLSPAQRGVALNVEGRGLFPHLTAERNLRFPLEMRRLSEQEMSDRVGAEARVMNLTEVLQRLPTTLSAGEQQRLSVGKATIRTAAAFLLDEPLHHLDAGERGRVGADLAMLLRGLGAPSIVVTHDIRQAMAFGDRLAVLDQGVLHQVGPTRELYARPATTVVAVTVGDPGMSLLPARIDDGVLVLGDRRLPFPGSGGDALRPYRGRSVLAGVRPEEVAIRPATTETLAARVEWVEHLGSVVLVRTRLVDATAGDVIVRAPRTARYRRGDEVHLALDPSRVSIFDPDTGLALWHPA